ncbi:MAG: LuxR C-terminal-related transcriptional regulator [Acidobacteriia bacterium]|nr:LuxR C-terminal-related transcriptional regulator [Terriglobia bacterium]
MKIDNFRSLILTPREQQVFRLVGDGLTSKEIAQCLEISQYTIHAHRRNICLKLEIHSAAELVSFAAKNKVSLRKG